VTYSYAGAALANELRTLSAGGLTTTYGYDGAGNTTSLVNNATLTRDKIDTHLSYDAQARPVTVTRVDATGVRTTVTMAYNAGGERARYTASMSGTVTADYRFAYAGGELARVTALTATLNADGSVKSSGGYTDSFVYGATGAPVEFVRTMGGVTTPYWYETDGRGSVVAVTDQSGAVVDRYAYDSWGETVGKDTQAVPQQLRYRGYWYDGELTWEWVAGRDYDPESLRYLQPVGDPSFVYAGDNPTSVADDGNGGVCVFTILLGRVCTHSAAVHAIYMFLIGSDQGILESDAPFISKALAVVDIASNVTLIIPVEGEVNRLAVKGGVLELEKLVARGARGAAYRYRIGHPVEQITRTIAHYTNRESYFYDVAKKYGINLRGIKIVFDPDLPPGRYGLTTAAGGGRVIHVGPDAFANDATAANTIAHELNHARDLIANGGQFRGDEETAQAAGDALQSYIEGRR